MPPIPEQILQQLSQQCAAIESINAAASGPQWGAMHQLLLKAKADPTQIMRLVTARDVPGLKILVATLRGEISAVPEIKPPARVAVDIALMQNALRTFRRRIKFAQLDADSKLGVGPMSGGGGKRIQSMVPPGEFSKEVWEALVDAGKLRREGQGFYSIIDTESGLHW